MGLIEQKYVEAANDLVAQRQHDIETANRFLKLLRQVEKEEGFRLLMEIFRKDDKKGDPSERRYVEIKACKIHAHSNLVICCEGFLVNRPGKDESTVWFAKPRARDFMTVTNHEDFETRASALRSEIIAIINDFDNRTLPLKLHFSPVKWFQELF